MKIILDSAVIAAAYAGRGLCSSLFELCLDRYSIIISNHILSGVYRFLHGKIKMPEGNASRIIESLREYCVVSVSRKLSEKVCRSKNNDTVIALALNSGAGYVVTGDRDLLEVSSYKTVKMISPRELWGIARERWE